MDASSLRTARSVIRVPRAGFVSYATATTSAGSASAAGISSAAHSTHQESEHSSDACAASCSRLNTVPWQVGSGGVPTMTTCGGPLGDADDDGSRAFSCASVSS